MERKVETIFDFYQLTFKLFYPQVIQVCPKKTVLRLSHQSFAIQYFAILYCVLKKAGNLPLLNTLNKYRVFCQILENQAIGRESSDY